MGRAGRAAAARPAAAADLRELRRIAHRQLGHERPGHTLSTTALVHEAYLRLVDQTRARWVDRAHFFAVAAGVMRRILVDYARRYRAAKRGGGAKQVDLDLAELPLKERSEMLITLDEALGRLATLNPRLSQVVEYRFFAGMTEEEAAEALGVTDGSVRWGWIKAKGVAVAGVAEPGVRAVTSRIGTEE